MAKTIYFTAVVVLNTGNATAESGKSGFTTNIIISNN